MIILMVTGNAVWNADGWKLMEFFFSLLRKDFFKKNMYPGMVIYISATSPVTNPRVYHVRESINTWYNMIYSTCISTARLGLCYNNARPLYVTTSKSFKITPKNQSTGASGSPLRGYFSALIRVTCCTGPQGMTATMGTYRLCSVLSPLVVHCFFVRWRKKQIWSCWYLPYIPK